MAWSSHVAVTQSSCVSVRNHPGKAQETPPVPQHQHWAQTRKLVQWAGGKHHFEHEQVTWGRMRIPSTSMMEVHVHFWSILFWTEVENNETARMGLRLLQPQSSKAQFPLENILSNKNQHPVKPFSSSTNNKAWGKNFKNQTKINKIFIQVQFQ